MSSTPVVPVPLIEKYDVVVIGAGPAGERGAAQAAYFGKTVAVIEKGTRPGGACVNTGTLPSKTFREAALHISGLASRGLTSAANIELNRAAAAVQMRKRFAQVASSEHERIRENLGRHNISYIEGSAVFESANLIYIYNRAGRIINAIETKFVLIATGSSPVRPKEVPFDDKTIWDSDSVLGITTIPNSMTVIGGGVIGSEYASIFAALGTKVYLIDGRDRLMPFIDFEISDVLMYELKKLGVNYHLKSKIAEYKIDGDKVSVRLESGEIIETETLLFAGGRNGNTASLGLEKIGIQPDARGALKVNENYQTNIPHIYAAGDVIGFPALASTSMDQARLAMCHALELTYKRRLTEHLPMGVYTIPEVSAVGATEEMLKAKGTDYQVGRAYFVDNARAEIMGELGGLLKILFDPKTLKLLGVHIVCERASEIVAPGQIAMSLGARLDFFIETVFNYPTLSEAYKYAAYDGLGKLSALGIDTGKAIDEKN